MKRAQSPLIFVFIAIVSLGVLLWGLGVFDGVKKSTQGAEMRNLALSMQRAVSQATPFDRVSEVQFAVPRAASTVCFVDGSAPFNELQKNKLTRTVSHYPSDNVFLSPFEDGISFDAGTIVLDENPLCVNTPHGRIDLRLVGRGNATLIQASETSDADCTHVVLNGDPDDKIDIVFLGYGYDDGDGFEEDVNNYVNGIFRGTAPFSTHFEKFNFYRIDDAQTTCTASGYLQCNSFTVKESASRCPNDYLFVLADRNKFKDAILPLRSSAISNIAVINTADHQLVLLHEFAHVFGDLADEYIDESYYRNFDVTEFPNCDFPGCSKWGSLTGGCFSGCSVKQFNRPTKESIMRNYVKSDEFGVVNERALERNIGFYR